MVKKKFLLFLIFLGIFGLSTINHLYAMEEPIPRTEPTSDISDFIVNYTPNSQIPYQTTPSMPRHLATTLGLINQFLLKVETLVNQMPGFIENPDDFIKNLYF